MIRAARHYPRLLMYRSNHYKSTYQFNGNFYVALEESDMNRKREAVMAHSSEYIRNGDSWLDYFIGQNRAAGLEVGCQYAEQFEVVKWLE